MNKLKLINSRELIKNISDTIYQNDNKITAVHIILPNKIGDYYRRTCSVELRAILPNGNYLPYVIDTNKESSVWYIENDLTERPQTVKLMMVITRAGNVIGRTNAVEFTVIAPEETVNPLTPREQFDERIAELENENEALERQVEAKDETITQQTEQITELNGEVTELEGTVTEQRATITRQNTTIDELNRRVPPLEVLEPINPSQIQQTYTPESPNIGFPQVIVNAPTAEGLGFREDYYKKDEVFLGKVGTYDPFPEHSVGGIYITEADEDGYPVKVVVQNLSKPKIPFVYPLNNDSFSKLALKSFKFKNCLQITMLANSCFENNSILKEVQLPEALVALPQFCFDKCSSLKEIDIPNTVKRIESYAFRYTAIEEIIIPHGVEYLGTQLFNSNALKTVSLPNTLTQTDGSMTWYLCGGLQNVTIENGFNCNNLKLSSSTLYSQETIVSWLEALADRTGLTAYTLTIGPSNINKLSQEQIAIAINKNWNLT